ncbi:hypothetical protein Mp_8g10890 [Marchantia polymorpha subsp. ruderalis]|uniref:Uncharacterized protein n=1 Tax=Marchantia polymorpha TaxID=3197 RepID=A0A2R6XMX3_MARPO|nr:hypothetical protein MARPO_0008s0134 [Marchantia polymorpha]BBN19464.1 hypothetical protein Mp_8g10890 [Marchantia polymorpha subsp. ruderalis]|eukprot:PTQ47366.1 hypothetical protein MARPO_0008s0134 [Marchantia polymorpha]
MVTTLSPSAQCVVETIFGELIRPNLTQFRARWSCVKRQTDSGTCSGRNRRNLRSTYSKRLFLHP